MFSYYKYVFSVDIAVSTAAKAVFSHQGQICIAASRLFVQSDIYDKFVEAATEYAKTIKIGNPADASTQHGPQVHYICLVC